MSAELATKTLRQYRCNFLTGPVTELIKLSRHISSLPPDIRSQVRITKILYTSESLLQSQRGLLMEIFNSPMIYSGLGSAEAGFLAVSTRSSPIMSKMPTLPTMEQTSYMIRGPCMLRFSHDRHLRAIPP